jgi:hypothetical protein
LVPVSAAAGRAALADLDVALHAALDTQLLDPHRQSVYVLAGAVVFFVGFFEGMPQLSWRIVPFTVAWSMMGAGLLFVMQLHMSWVLLVPYVPAALIAVALSEKRPQAIASAVVAFGVGAAVPGILLLPTILRFGWNAGHVEGAVAFHQQSPFELVTTAARVLSFASFEVNRFVGMSTAERLLVFWRHPVVALAVIPVAIAGVLQPLWMAVSALRPAGPGTPATKDWMRVRVLMLATIVLITGSYYFSCAGRRRTPSTSSFPSRRCLPSPVGTCAHEPQAAGFFASSAWRWWRSSRTWCCTPVWRSIGFTGSRSTLIGAWSWPRSPTVTTATLATGAIRRMDKQAVSRGRPIE